MQTGICRSFDSWTIEIRNDAFGAPGEYLPGGAYVIQNSVVSVQQGGMVPIEPSEDDWKMLNDIAKNFVVQRWAKRCGTQKCVDDWNAMSDEEKAEALAAAN